MHVLGARLRERRATSARLEMVCVRAVRVGGRFFRGIFRGKILRHYFALCVPLQRGLFDDGDVDLLGVVVEAVEEDAEDAVLE